jgi:hypothetical protein
VPQRHIGIALDLAAAARRIAAAHAPVKTVVR